MNHRSTFTPHVSRLTFHVLRLTLCAALALALMPAPPAQAASFTVNSTTDAVDASPGDGVCASAGGVCTLRAAIQEANALPGADEITLPAGTYTLTIPGADENAAATGDLDLADNVTLTGEGAATTIIDGNGIVIRDRVFHILPDPAIVILAGVTIRRGQTFSDGAGIYNQGQLSLSDSTIARNVTTGDGDGGGIYNSGTLTLTTSTIFANRSDLGGGILNEFSARLTIEASTLSGNRATYWGGAIANQGGQLTVTNSTLARNSVTSALAGGGAIYTTACGSLTIDSSALFANRTNGDGGALLTNSCSTITITNSTLSGNAANAAGAVLMFGGTLIIGNGTLSGNTAQTYGGALAASFNSSVTLSNVTLAQNSAGFGAGGIREVDSTVTLRNTLLAENSASGAPNCLGELFSFGYNLVGNNSGCTFTSAEGDQVGTAENPIDPLLGPLQDNGGPTRTHALLDGGPAIDAGNPDGCSDELGNLLPTDQRGFERHVDGDGNGSAICDIGGYEYGAGP